MAKCAYCRTAILFGGVRDADLRFCTEECHRNGYALVVAKEIPQTVVDQQAGEIHRGRCPECKGSGPIDVHTSYRVYSLILYTSWSNRPNVCCRSCGVKSQLGDAFFSLVLGWWGFPWGLIMTPVQVVRNLGGAFAGEELRPSEKLKQLVRVMIARRLIEEQGRRIT